MGYTHYFKQKKAVDDQTWKKITSDAQKIVDHLKNELPSMKLGSDDPNGQMFNNERINLNDIHYGHETFYLPKEESGFHFCKTAQKPYDLAVCSILLLVHHYAPNHYDISSDGTSEDWAEAVDFNARKLGYAYKLPPALQDYESPEIESDAQKVAEKLFPQKDNKPNNDIAKVNPTSEEPVSRRFKF